MITILVAVVAAKQIKQLKELLIFLLLFPHGVEEGGSSL